MTWKVHSNHAVFSSPVLIPAPANASPSLQSNHFFCCKDRSWKLLVRKWNWLARCCQIDTHGVSTDYAYYPADGALPSCHEDGKISWLPKQIGANRGHMFAWMRWINPWYLFAIRVQASSESNHPSYISRHLSMTLGINCINLRICSISKLRIPLKTTQLAVF